MVYWEVLIRNPDLEFQNSDPKIRFLANLGRKSQSCPFYLKIGTHDILEKLILIPDLDFRNSCRRIHFWANLGRKSQSCPFCLKIGTQSISKMLSLIPTLVFWISNPKSIFGQVWDKKVIAVCFAWKLAHTHTHTHTHTEYLKDADSYFDVSFLKFQTHISRC